MNRIDVPEEDIMIDISETISEEDITDLAVVGPNGNAERDLMVLSYLIVAFKLINSDLVTKDGKNNTISYEQLQKALSDLANANTADDVLGATLLNTDSIWHMIYVDPGAGYKLSLHKHEGDGKVKLMLTPSNEDIDRGVTIPISKTGDPSYFAYCWSYLFGDLGSAKERMFGLLARDHYKDLVYFLNLYTAVTDVTVEKMIPPFLYYSAHIGGLLLSDVNCSTVARLSEEEKNQFKSCAKFIFRGFVNLEVVEKSSRANFIIPLVLMFAIPTLTNIVAWANVIAINSIVIKAIISGFGNVAAIVALVFTIRAAYANKMLNCNKDQKTNIKIYDYEVDKSEEEMQKALDQQYPSGLLPLDQWKQRDI
jgi:hypothetical protein